MIDGTKTPEEPEIQIEHVDKPSVSLSLLYNVF